MRQQSKYLTEKTLFKDSIHDIDYTPVLAGIYMMEPATGIEHVKVEIRRFNDKLKRKHKVNAVMNYRMDLVYMNDTEPGYS